MTTPEPDRQGTPDESDATPPGAGEVWLKLLADDERAIRESAPKEPSARERASARPARRLDANRQHTRGPRPDHTPAHDRTEAVGDLWQPEGPEPAWRELDGPARLRRAGRVIATVAVISLALGAWSLLSTTAGTPSDEPDVHTVQEVEEVEEVEEAPAPVPAACGGRATTPGRPRDRPGPPDSHGLSCPAAPRALSAGHVFLRHW
ncbi:hypothetical protein [Streptomyces massasporeus]|uniref:hypothetical protein n=1 Tax=Streptomyces massasporeus TaxID=67324 RepID=UPI0033C29B7B